MLRACCNDDRPRAELFEACTFVCVHVRSRVHACPYTTFFLSFFKRVRIYRSCICKTSTYMPSSCLFLCKFYDFMSQKRKRICAHKFVFKYLLHACSLHGEGIDAPFFLRGEKS